MDRKISRNIIGILTSHDGLNFYKKRLNYEENNHGICRFCSNSKENLSHIIFDCPCNPLRPSLYTSLCNLSDNFIYIYKEKNLKFLLLPMFYMISPGKYMSQTLCLKIYKLLDEFMINVFKWKQIIPQNKTINNNKENENIENNFDYVDQKSENHNFSDEDSKKKVLLDKDFICNKKKSGPPKLEVYDKTVKRDYRVMLNVSIPPKKKKKKTKKYESESESESEDFDLIINAIDNKK